MMKGRHRETAALFDEVAGAAYATPDAELFRTVMLDSGWCRMMMHDPIEAKRFLTMGLERKGISVFQSKQHFWFLAVSEVTSGDLGRAKSIVAEHKVPLSAPIVIAIREGNWDAAIKMQQTMLEFAQRTGNRFQELVTLYYFTQVSRFAGDFQRAATYLAQALRVYDEGNFYWQMRIRPEAAMLAVAMGQPDGALQHLQVCRAIVAQGEDWAGWGVTLERAEGMLAAAQGGEYAPHFEKAIAVAKRYCLPFGEADTLHEWGVALRRAGEAEEANTKFDAAIAIYRDHGAGPRWIERVEAARSSSDSAGKIHEPKGDSAVTGIFCREGEFWTLTFSGATFRLRHIKGLGYLAHLIAHPGEQFHVTDVVALVQASAGGNRAVDDLIEGRLTFARDLDGAPPPLDATARANYRTRIKELDGDLDEAERLNDIGRATRIREELDALRMSSALALESAAVRARPGLIPSAPA